MPQQVDFGRKEQQLLQDLWHSKVDHLLCKLNEKTEVLDEDMFEEDISCEWPRQWLDEAEQLGIMDDIKVIKLNKLV